jgi:hypothetical protein
VTPLVSLPLLPVWDNVPFNILTVDVGIADIVDDNGNGNEDDTRAKLLVITLIGSPPNTYDDEDIGRHELGDANDSSDGGNNDKVEDDEGNDNGNNIGEFGNARIGFGMAILSMPLP